MRLNNRFVLATTPLLISLFVKALKGTMRFKDEGYEEIRERWDKGLPSIFALWHQRLLMMPFIRDSKLPHVLISNHRDGELISRTVAHFGMPSVRGSATRGGASGFRQMVKVIEGGGSIAITPDGPRGPKWQVRMGAIALGKATSAPIFPVTYACSRRKEFKSWDNFILPAPFSRGIFLAGEAINVPSDADDVMMDSLREELQRRLIEITQRAEEIVR